MTRFFSSSTQYINTAVCEEDFLMLLVVCTSHSLFSRFCIWFLKLDELTNCISCNYTKAGKFIQFTKRSLPKLNLLNRSFTG